MSEGKRRKHADDEDAVSGSQKKGRDEVTDDEVEEFYAILRRINAAAKYFKSGNDHDVIAKEEGTPPQNRWRASLEKEIMNQVNGVKAETSGQEDVQQNLNLDLNSSPQPE